MYDTIFNKVIFPALELVLRRHISSTAAKYASLQYEPYEQLKMRQETKMRRLMQHAFQNVPFYREKFEQAGLKPKDIQTIEDLPRLPVVTKEEIRANFPHQVTASNIARQRRIPAWTSGSTGEPLNFYVDSLSRDSRAAAFAFFNSWAGVRNGDKGLHLGLGYPRTFIQKAFGLVARQHYIASLSMDKDNVIKVCSQLAKMKLDFIGGNAFTISWIASVAKHNNIKIRPEKAVISTMEILLSKQFLEDAFQCPVFNRYGNREVGGALVQNCPESDKMHVNTELCILEIVDEEGNTCAPGWGGRIVLTDLNNWVMPFIRYDTEDGAKAGEPCPCGRTLPVIENLEPRLTWYIQTPSGKTISSRALGGFLFKMRDYMPHFVRFQAVQKNPSEVTFNFVPLQSITQELLSRLSDDLQLLLGNDVNIVVNTVDDIPIAPSGKLEIIKSEL